MKILITGAAGFVGTNLTLNLLGAGHDVIGADSLSRLGSERNLEEIRRQAQKFSFYMKEIEDFPALIHQTKPDLIYHFAAQVAVTHSVQNPERDFKVNAEGTFNVARTAHDLGIPFIYTSTNKVYGDNVNKIPIRELDTRYDFEGELSGKGIPETFSIDAQHHTPYGCSKLVGDIYVREFGGVSNRCSCMYGPNQHGIADQGWISHIIKNILLGKQVIIYGDGKQVRDILHSSDVVRLLNLQGRTLLEERVDIRGEVFNVGGGYGNTVSILELCRRLGLKREHLGFADWRPADQKVFYCDIQKAGRVLGWKPKIPLEQGVNELYDWTKTHLSRFN